MGTSPLVSRISVIRAFFVVVIVVFLEIRFHLSNVSKMLLAQGSPG